MTNILIKIEDIENSKGKSLHFKFEDFIDGIESEEAIKAELELISLGDFIEVTGQVEGTAILECDLCLEKFEYKLDFGIEELFAKNSLMGDDVEAGQEIELKEGQFVTDLQGCNSLDISDLLYQSVILDFPNKKVCGINCKGGDIFIRDEDDTEKEVDPRLAVFKSININNK